MTDLVILDNKNEIENLASRSKMVLMVIERMLEHRPKRATGMYLTGTRAVWGYRTNPRKFPKNWISLRQLDGMVT